MDAGANYVAMGSSFASGPGIPPRVQGSPTAAGRSENNYAHLVAGKAGLELTDVTYGGATTEDLLTRSQRGAPPQVDALREATDLVTITCGGNDLFYLAGLTMSSTPKWVRSLPPVKRVLTQALDTTEFDDRVAGLESRLATILEVTHHRAPHAEVILLDYLTIVPASSSVPNPGLPPEVAEWGRLVSGRLTEALRTGAAAGGARFIDVGAASAEHHAWSAEPWTNRFDFSLRGWAPYHPNAAGMRAEADMILAALA